MLHGSLAVHESEGVARCAVLDRFVVRCSRAGPGPRHMMPRHTLGVLLMTFTLYRVLHGLLHVLGVSPAGCDSAETTHSPKYTRPGKKVKTRS